MKSNLRIQTWPVLGLALLALGAVGSQAATPALQGQIALRPVTPSDIGDYKLPTTTEYSGGLSTTPVGEPVYFEAQINSAIPASNIVSVAWVITSQPAGSSAALSASPLGMNVPVYLPQDQAVCQVAGRTVLRPDQRGAYTVSATITTANYGTTNVSRTINAGVYMGVKYCFYCHSGTVAPNMTSFTNTLHATKFTRSIDGLVGSYSKSCISCHTLGYDVNSTGYNNGFDDVAATNGWKFPTVLTNGNWAAMPPELQNLANIQCENCHGPGSEHAYSLGDPNLIAISTGAGNCGQCHDAKSHHIKVPEWKNSRHAVATRTPSGANRNNCVRCHTAAGFAGYVENLGNNQGYTTNTVYESITCVACHDPHDATNPHQLRASPSVALNNGLTVTNAGLGGFCMNCHQSRTGSVTNSIVNYPLGLATWANGSSFGPHDNPAADMLEGVNGYTYGKDIPSSAHRFAVTNTCVTCHMQEVASTDPAFLQAGGHTFNMTFKMVNNGVTNTVDKVDVCVECHGPITSFDLVKVDYNGDGVIEGVQTEVQHLLDRLSTLMPGSAYRADGNYVADGVVKSSLSVKTNWQAKFLEAAWNFQLVGNDASKGVHNAAYAVGLLKASIGDLTGDANSDGLPDAWQTQYFGSASNPNAAPGACPSGDGTPNWLKYTLGLDPTVPGVVMPDGVVWANARTLGGDSDTLHIYTAAEVSFNTEVGKTYQIESISSLGGGWKPVGAPIQGTGGAVSYVTPTRGSVPQFYRVSHTP